MKTFSPLANLACLAYQQSPLPVHTTSAAEKYDEIVGTPNGVTIHVFKRDDAETPSPLSPGYGKCDKRETSPRLYGYDENRTCECC